MHMKHATPQLFVIPEVSNNLLELEWYLLRGGVAPAAIAGGQRR